MRDAYIWHLTLDTRHTRRSYRSEVGDDIVDLMTPWLDQQETILPRTPSGEGYRLVVPYRTKYCMAATVFSPANAPLVTMFVAARSRCAGMMWERAMDTFQGDAPVGLARPELPWCAVRLWPSVITDQGAMEWLGDFERCFAWALIDGAKR